MSATVSRALTFLPLVVVGSQEDGSTEALSTAACERENSLAAAWRLAYAGGSPAHATHSRLMSSLASGSFT